MPDTTHAETLNRQSLFAFPSYFASLPPPEMAALTGVWRAEFVGPGWLRRIAPPGLALLGLGGWWGKEFTSPGKASNIVERDGSLLRVLPMLVKEAVSLVDGQRGVAISYPSGSPFPWPWVVDEVRRLDETTLLALTLTTPRWLPRLPMPFLLHRQEQSKI